MIYVETKLKRVPESCKNCRFRQHEFFGNDVCSITKTEIPVDKKTYKIGKCKNCPIFEADISDWSNC